MIKDFSQPYVTGQQIMQGIAPVAEAVDRSRQRKKLENQKLIMGQYIDAIQSADIDTMRTLERNNPIMVEQFSKMHALANDRQDKIVTNLSRELLGGADVNAVADKYGATLDAVGLTGWGDRLRNMSQDQIRTFALTNMARDPNFSNYAELFGAGDAGKVDTVGGVQKLNNGNLGVVVKDPMADGGIRVVDTGEKFRPDLNTFDFQGVTYKYDPETRSLEPLISAKDKGVQDEVKAGAVLEGESESIVTQAKEGAEASGDFFDMLNTTDQYIANYNRAIRLLDEGAGTGRIESLFPSFKSSSIELDNMRNQLGLNVISTGKFGPLSEGELRMALSTALPQGLDEPALRDWLTEKRDAQQKLRDYYEEAALFLSEPGATKAQWYKKQKDIREAKKAEIAAAKAWLKANPDDPKAEAVRARLEQLER